MIVFRRPIRLLACGVAVWTMALVASVRAQPPILVPPPLLASLKHTRVPEPPNLSDYVADRDAAIVLGKALFWDAQVGTDGVACATCHFSAGADPRGKNQLNPNGTNADPAAARTFDAMANGGRSGPNYTLHAADFPFHRLLDPLDRDSPVVFTTNDVVSSQGVFNSTFAGITDGNERQDLVADDVFQVGGVAVRRVEPRNAPTVINAVFNFRNFWDGRANNVFNGVNPFGARDADARIWVNDWKQNEEGYWVETARPATVRLRDSSLASQAVGPPLSFFEMSAADRGFPDLGRKMLWTARPLLDQEVAPDDSVLGPYRHSSGKGLGVDYETLIQRAFRPELWQTPDWVFYDASGTGYRQIEMNFSLFFGLAIQMYESTLVSDDSPFDRFMSGSFAALTPQQRLGKTIFESKGKCVECHRGPELTAAATTLHIRDQLGGLIERMSMGNGFFGIYDSGFYNVGVVPAANDAGLGGSDPFGYPLSFTRQYRSVLSGGSMPDAIIVSACTFSVNPCQAIGSPSFRDVVDGAFKTPTLRNVELTGPYFHNGGYATLESVVEFYNRGGNRRLSAGGDTTGLGPNASNLDVDIEPLGLTPAEQAALVAFLKALTDERVRWEQTPFDHPALTVSHGEQGDEHAVGIAEDGRAADLELRLPAVGRLGRGPLGPLKPFTPIP